MFDVLPVGCVADVLRPVVWVLPGALSGILGAGSCVQTCEGAGHSQVSQCVEEN